MIPSSPSHLGDCILCIMHYVPRVRALYPVTVAAVRHGESAVLGGVVVPAVDHPRLHPVVGEHVGVQLEGSPLLAAGEPDLDPVTAA